MSQARQIPPVAVVVTDDQVAFAASVIDDSKVAEELEGLLVRQSGRPRSISVRALLIALLALATLDRPLHLKAATKLLFSELSPNWRQNLGVVGTADGRKAFLARYRQVRYLFHLALSVMDPSIEQKNRVMDERCAKQMRRKLTDDEIAEASRRLSAMIGKLVQSSVEVMSDEELDSFDGSVGLDATPVPLFSRGPAKSSGTTASDPDGGWYIREGDHRLAEGPTGKKLRKIYWALEATIVVMGRPPGSVPTWPNLVVGVSLARPGEDPGGSGVRLLASLKSRGHPAGFLGADRGYTQCLPEHFHLPARALGYKVVMDYKAADLGIQANSGGAVLVDGAFYCPAMPDALVTASAERRDGLIEEATYADRIEARASWRLVRKEGPDKDGYERFSCPAQGEHPKLCCPLRSDANSKDPNSKDPNSKALGKIPVLSPPGDPPRCCTQTAITIAPDVGARFRQDLAFGSPEWAATYAAYRNTIEGLNGYLKDSAHENLAAPGRRRVRGIAAQSVFVAILVMAANIRKIAAHRLLVKEGLGQKVAERARRRRMSLADHEPPPP